MKLFAADTFYANRFRQIGCDSGVGAGVIRKIQREAKVRSPQLIRDAEGKKTSRRSVVRDR